MATLKFFTKGNNNPTSIYLRFAHGRKFDFTKSTGLFIDSNNWNNKKGIVRNVADFEGKLNLQKKLNDLQNNIIGSFNTDFPNGIEIDSNWLETKIKTFFNQKDSNDLEYFVNYGNLFVKNLDTKIQKNGNTGVTPATKGKYTTVVKKISDFENHNKRKLKLKDIDLKFHKDFIAFLYNVQKLNYNTIGKYIAFVKTIVLDAKEHGIKTNMDISKSDFRPTKEKITFVTLNEQEIDSIFNYDFKDTPYLENARDWLIVGLWTGARSGDLLKLTKNNISNGFLEYTAQKTAQKIVLPLILSGKDGKLVLGENSSLIKDISEY